MRLPALEAEASGPAGLHPDELDPTRLDASGRLETRSAKFRWGHCAWAHDGGVCLWGGSPGVDNREVFMIGRGGERRAARHAGAPRGPRSRARVSGSARLSSRLRAPPSFPSRQRRRRRRGRSRRERPPAVPNAPPGCSGRPGGPAAPTRAPPSSRVRPVRPTLPPPPTRQNPPPALSFVSFGTGTQRRERWLSTGERPPWRESHTCVPVTRGASVAHVVFGGFGEPKPETRSSTASDAAAQLSSSSAQLCEGAPLNDAFLVDANLRWRALRPSGPAPTPRGGHAACAVSAAEVLVFGGRDARGRYLNDVAVLELNSAAAMAAGWSGRHLDSAWGFPDPRGDPSFRGARLSSGGGGADAADHERAGEASDSEASRGVCFEDASRPRGRFFRRRRRRRRRSERFESRRGRVPGRSLALLRRGRAVDVVRRRALGASGGAKSGGG